MLFLSLDSYYCCSFQTGLDPVFKFSRNPFFPNKYYKRIQELLCSKNKTRHSKNRMGKFAKWFKYYHLKLCSILKNPSFSPLSHFPFLAEANIGSGATLLNSAFITFTCWLIRSSDILTHLIACHSIKMKDLFSSPSLLYSSTNAWFHSLHNMYLF